MNNIRKPYHYPQWILWLVAGIMLFGCSDKPDNTVDYNSLSDAEKRSPEHALDGLEVAEDLKTTAFATEPMLVNPTNMAIDERGRVWVCEGVNYRPELNPGNPTKDEGDRILILEDRDGDGEADQSTVFYQGTDVNAALGIWAVGNQAIVSCSPNVFLLTDTDGDDKADKKEILFTGIQGVQHDHAIHAFTFGPDGKLYFNFGNAGEKILDKNGNPITEQTGVEVSNNVQPYQQGMVFRCDPDGSNFEVLGDNFRNNYEVAVDSYGTLWQSDNDDDGNKGVRINYVMEYGNYGYRDEQTGEDWRTYRTGMEEEIPLRHWHLNDPGVVPNLLQTGAGSPTGMLIYEGDLLPERFHNQIIHADAGPNVVRAYPVENDGAGYKATIDNIIQGKDQWFRPADVCVAPDGSLFVADWYDPGVGGHQMGDLQEGRIFHLAPHTRYEVPEYDMSTPEGAVEALKNPNLAVRAQAWKALHAWQGKAEPALNTLLESDNPRYRARALWLLTKIEGKGDKYVERALKDEDPNIRIAGIRMARQLDQNILPRLKQLKEDPSPQVRREVALALRYLDSPEADQVWATLAMQHDGKDRWYLEALGIGADEHPESRFQAWLAQVGDDWNSPAGRDIVWRMRAKETIPLLAQFIEHSESNTRHDRLRYFRAFDFQQDPSKQEVLANLAVQQHPNQEEITLLALSHLNTETVNQSSELKQALRSALEQVEGTQEYIELVKRYQLKDQQANLLALTLSRPDEEIGSEAVRLLMNLGGDKAMKKIMNESSPEEKEALIQAIKRVNNEQSLALLRTIILDKQQPLDIRKEAVLAFTGSWGGEDLLMEMVKSGDLDSGLDSAAAQVFSNAMRNDMFQEVALMLDLPTEATNDEQYDVKALLAMSGDAEAGQTVFAKLCQNCHQVNGKGIDYGPALSEIGSKLGKDGLYSAILEPSKGISFGYEGYNLTLQDGSHVTGYILNQNEDEVQLRQYGGLTTTYQRSEIAAMEEMKQSLMFDNLERGMSQQEFVDLVEYLFSLKKGNTQISMQ